MKAAPRYYNSCEDARKFWSVNALFWWRKTLGQKQRKMLFAPATGMPEIDLRLVLRDCNHAFKPNLAWVNEPVAWRQVSRDVETTLASRARVAAGTSRDLERHTVRVC